MSRDQAPAETRDQMFARLCEQWLRSYRHGGRINALGHSAADLVEELSKRLDPPGSPKGWQPIASAVKDGTPMMIGWFENGVWTERRAWFDAQFECSGYDESNDLSLYRGAWTDDAVQSFGYEETREYQPTHWMPLPDPPVDQGTPEREKGL